MSRLVEYRQQMFSLWGYARTPVAYRSKFWFLINGSGFLHLAIHEDELLRLWGDLGLDEFAPHTRPRHLSEQNQISTLTSSPRPSEDEDEGENENENENEGEDEGEDEGENTSHY